jgi:flagellar hook-associated protein 3 FlgL
MPPSRTEDTEQYQRNSDYAKPKLEYEEAQIVALGNYMQRVRELVVAGNNDTYNPENRKIIASEIRQLREDILGLANSEDANGEYLFARHALCSVSRSSSATTVG